MLSGCSVLPKATKSSSKLTSQHPFLQLTFISKDNHWILFQRTHQNYFSTYNNLSQFFGLAFHTLDLLTFKKNH